jgi:hypothetical protein
MSLGNSLLRRVSMRLQGNDDGVGFGVKGTSLNNTGVLGASNNGAGVFGSSIGARWLKPLHHFTRLFALLTIALVVADAKAQSSGFGLGWQVGAVSRFTDTLDVFAADFYGVMKHAGWGERSLFWQGFVHIPDTGYQPYISFAGGPVTAINPNNGGGRVDLFTVADNGQVYHSVTFNPYDANLYSWTQIGNLSAGLGCYVSAVTRSLNNYDLFVAGSDGQVWTADYGLFPA